MVNFLSESLEAEIASHDAFFSRMIEMIPRDLYRPVEEEDEEVLNSRYHKHRKMPLQLDEKKAISKKRLKEIYEPKSKDKAMGAIEKEDEVRSVDEKDVVDETPSVDDGLDALRQRLQARITSLKGNRSTSDRNNSKKKNAADNKKQVPKNRPSKAGGNALADGSAQQLPATADTVAKQVSRGVLDDMLQASAETGESMGDDIQYSGLVDSSEGAKRADFGKSGSKLRRLKKLIEDTDAKKKRISDLKSLGEEGKQQALQEQWTDVLKEASGTKVLANTAKIKKALKRKEKAKEKSAKEWAERTANVDSAINKRLDKREENLLKRKRGPDWIPPPGEEPEKQPAEEKKRGVPIKGNFGDKNKDSAKKGGHSQGKSAGGGIKGRAGFEGKKTDFLNKKHKK